MELTNWMYIPFFKMSTDSRTRGHNFEIVKQQNRTKQRASVFSQRVINPWLMVDGIPYPRIVLTVIQSTNSSPLSTTLGRTTDRNSAVCNSKYLPATLQPSFKYIFNQEDCSAAVMDHYKQYLLK